MNPDTELEIWNSLATEYSDWVSGLTSERGRLLHETLLKGIRDVCPRRVSSVTDIGCGDGRILHELFADTEVSVVGVDGSAEMLTLAKSTFPRLKTIKAALDSQIPIPSASMDLVFCTMTLMYAERVELVLHEIERIMASDGMAIISVPHPCYFNRRGTLETFDYWECRRYVKYLDPVFSRPVSQFHRPLSAYVSGFREAGLFLESLVETRILPTSARVGKKLTFQYETPCHIIFVLKRGQSQSTGDSGPADSHIE